ncbi:ESCRT-II complex subunit-domain-containing protein, partial [Protomyces lactucae-debilis]
LELPQIHSFPPLFTRQPNQETFISQRASWIALILFYYKAKRLHQLPITEETLDNELFHNQAIGRRLKLETLREIIEEMVQQGSAIYTSKAKTGAYIYWRRPEEWAARLQKYIEDTGQTGSVLTVYELTQEDRVADQDFYQLDPAILRSAIQVLAKKGKAQMMKGSDGEEVGIK